MCNDWNRSAKFKEKNQQNQSFIKGPGKPLNKYRKTVASRIPQAERREMSCIT